MPTILGASQVDIVANYDLDGTRSALSVTINGSSAVQRNYAYDQVGRESEIGQSNALGGDLSASGHVVRAFVSYNAAGQPTGILRQYGVQTGAFTTYSTGRSTSFGYAASSTAPLDPAGRLRTIRHGDLSYSYEFDPANRVVSWSLSQTSSGSLPTLLEQQNVSYDAADQVRAVDAQGLAFDEAYAYDSLGNRRGPVSSLPGSQTGLLPATTTGVFNRLSSDGTYQYLFDALGQLTTRTQLVNGNATGPKTTYAWDHRGRLTRVEQFSTSTATTPSSSVSYEYDALDRRIVRTQGSAVERYVYDGDQILLSFGKGDGTQPPRAEHLYLYSAAVDQVLADERLTVSPSAEDRVVWLLNDAQGTARDLVSRSGQQTNHRTFDSFGRLAAQTNAALDTLMAYTGQPRDPLTGLQDHQARWYDPGTGRFLSEDPLSFAGGDENLYAYVGNRSPNALDRDGRLSRNTGGLGALVSTGSLIDGAIGNPAYGGFSTYVGAAPIGLSGGAAPMTPAPRPATSAAPGTITGVTGGSVIGSSIYAFGANVTSRVGGAIASAYNGITSFFSSIGELAIHPSSLGGAASGFTQGWTDTYTTPIANAMLTRAGAVNNHDPGVGSLTQYGLEELLGASKTAQAAVGSTYSGQLATESLFAGGKRTEDLFMGVSQLAGSLSFAAGAMPRVRISLPTLGTATLPVPSPSSMETIASGYGMAAEMPKTPFAAIAERIPLPTSRSISSGSALVSMEEAAYNTSTVRNVAGYEVAGNAGLVGDTYNMNIWGLYRTDNSHGLSALADAVRAEASAAGASNISIVGVAIINKGIQNLSPRAAARLGFQVETVNASTIILRGGVR